MRLWLTFAFHFCIMQATEKKKTLILGASPNPQRYSYLAIDRLRNAGHEVVAIGRKNAVVKDVQIDTEQKPYTDVHTVTLYLNPLHQKEYYNYILSLQPKRIIFNPGAENDELYRIATDHAIKAQEACTLVLLSTGQY
jgi:predicted CoA-binding protein